VIYGVVLRRSQTVPRIIAAQTIDCILVSLILTPIWLMLLYGNAFIPIFVGRLPKVLIMFPINVILLSLVIGASRRFIRRPDR